MLETPRVDISKHPKPAYLCFLCGATTQGAGDLQRHVVVTHAPPTSNCVKLRCDRKGENGFKSKSNLNKHLRSVHMVKFLDYSRDMCRRKGLNGFLNEDQRKGHLRDKHGEEMDEEES